MGRRIWNEALRAVTILGLLAAGVPEARAQNNLYVKPLVWGAFTEEATGINNLVVETGKIPDIVATFVNLGPDLEMPSDMMNIALKNKSTLLIYLETKENNLEMMDVETRQYVKTLADDLKKYPGEVILVPMPEMNGDWSAWDKADPTNTPETFKKAFGMIRQQFKNVPNVKFGWAVNETMDNIDPFYPGNEYVDIVGVDGFNWGNDDWRSPDEIFGSTIDQLDNYNKPVYIFSAGSAEGNGKAEWMRKLFVLVKDKDVKGVVLFNVNKERNWSITNDKNTLEVIKEVLP